MADIEGAFELFARALRDGRFDLPVDPTAWPAELVAAHLIMSNDLFTEAARDVRAGRQPTYDNERTHDGNALREVLIRTGSRPELADEVERSASDLQAAYEMLEPRQRQATMSTRIFREGELIMDGQRLLGEMIDGNAGFHLDAHLTQLLDLRD